MSPQRVVLDTNVLVSALLSSFGAPGRVLDLALAGELAVVYDDRVLAEWREVLSRDKFGFAAADVEALLNFLEREGSQVIPTVLAVELPDPDDVPFLEVAVASGASLITGNLRHYPSETRHGAEIMAPHEFLQRWATGSSSEPVP